MKIDNLNYLGEKLALVSAAKLNDESSHYTVRAVDSAGDVYEVEWEIIVDDISQIEDESLACNWDKYEVYKF